ncbi:nitroreductase family deazaflavin-dependent oxidoreductase [Frankia sp. QA3]|uniref:nitroreductase family deazaflavin-dependent oxidoreductase n=1 Tax=Frankia sp. QA3 TaxID=710111 RepID=UPI00056C0998|nr:nitroreductase family deazaflavin-dependent oxidoreductase [Frankia sp. QA3]
MPIPRIVARLNRAGPNRVVRRVAPRLPGMGVVVHRGRRSGRTYQTPVNVFPTAGGVRIALTYGADSEWVRNVVAAGGCRLRTRGGELTLEAPRIVHDPNRRDIRPVAARVLRLLGFADFLDLTRTPPTAADAP